MKISIKLFVTAFLATMLLISCGSDDSGNKPEESKSEVLKSVKFNKSDNGILADDFTAKISKSKNELTVVISVLLESSKFDDDVILKAQIQTSENNSISGPITIKKGVTEVPVEIMLNGTKVKYILKPKINFIKKEFEGVMNAKDLSALYTLSTNPQLANIFENLDLNSLEPSELVDVIEGLQSDANAVDNVFEFDDDDRIVWVSIQNMSLNGAPPSGVFDFEELTHLNMSGTDIDELPADIGNLNKLKLLNISSTNISVIPTEIGQLIDLENFTANNCRITEISEELGNCKELKILNLSNNKAMEEMPAFIGELTKLETLNFDNCRITEIIPGISNLVNLRELFIRDNVRLNAIPVGIGFCTSLKVLELENNSIEVIPSSIEELTALYRLRLNGNRIKVIPSEIGALIDIETLHLDDNLIEVIPSEIGNLTKMKELNLKNNNLKRFEGGTVLTGLRGMRLMYLDGEPAPSHSDVLVSHEGNKLFKISQEHYDYLKDSSRVTDFKINDESKP